MIAGAKNGACGEERRPGPPYRMRLLGPSLIPLAWVYGRAALVRRRWLSRRARRLSVPVISVGNITCGGTGKTPTVEMIARDLLALKRRPAFLSRGYARHGERGGNDEYQVLAQNLPEVAHFQAPDRYQEGLKAVAAGADVLILDDGFQHVRLHRDLDLVLVDALSPFGGWQPLPAGFLREPLEALKSAHLLGITRSDQVAPMTLSTLSAYLRCRFPAIPQLVMETHPVQWVRLDGSTAPPAALRGARVLAFCGIGNPEGFRRQLQSSGVELAAVIPFRDHHRYTGADLERIARRASELGVNEVVMTQKDAVKLRPGRASLSGGEGRWWCLKIEQRVVRGAEEYVGALKRLLAQQ